LPNGAKLPLGEPFFFLPVGLEPALGLQAELLLGLAGLLLGLDRWHERVGYCIVDYCIVDYCILTMV
jgi:hypothetical protein